MHTNRNEPRTHHSADNRTGLRWFGVIFALVFPSIITWVYFVFAADYSSGVQQATYVAVKCVQFAFPLIWVWIVLREPLRTRPAGPRGLLIGAAFSAVVVAAGWLVFHLALRDTRVFTLAAAKIHDKIAQFGIDTTWKYSILGVFYSIVHSLLEEYYWRWFAFRQLRKLVPLWPAVFVSAIAFAGHHVIPLGEFFREVPWLAWLFASAVAIGGVFWAWLYERSGSLYSTWLSHLLIDAGIFWIGYELVRSAMSGSG
ncbi:MAG TPA: type II CAAX endopeptidase family protein [Lacipirellulaceae bacterium]|nr:type II CAAX endopeptidase family protein [Lacipirellulaceae bacterium]